jgi:hypothetical protein
MIGQLCSISQFLQNPSDDNSYDAGAWDMIVQSPIIPCLLSSIDPNANGQLLSTMLMTLTDVLSYPPDTEFYRIPWGRLNLEPLLACSEDLCRPERFGTAYLLLMSRIATLCCPSFGELYHVAIRLNDLAPEPTLSPRFRGEIVTLIRGCFASQRPPAVHDYLDWFQRLWLSSGWRDSSLALASALVDAMRVAIRYFVQDCGLGLRSAFEGVFQEMSRRSEVYETLRPVVLTALLPLAEFDPDQVPWNMDLLQNLGDPENEDEGIPALEITHIVINRAIHPPDFPPDDFLHWIVAHLTHKHRFTTKPKILDILDRYLTRYVTGPIDQDYYQGFFHHQLVESLVDYTGDELRPADTRDSTFGTAGIVASIARWFLERGIGRDCTGLADWAFSIPSPVFKPPETAEARADRERPEDADGNEITEEGLEAAEGDQMVHEEEHQAEGEQNGEPEEDDEDRPIPDERGLVFVEKNDEPEEAAEGEEEEEEEPVEEEEEEEEEEEDVWDVGDPSLNF